MPICLGKYNKTFETIETQKQFWSVNFYSIKCVCAKLLQSCLTFCDPMNCSPPGSSVRGILQARILGWVAMPFSRASSRPRAQTTSLKYPALADSFLASSVLPKRIRILWSVGMLLSAYITKIYPVLCTFNKWCFQKWSRSVVSNS